MSQKNKRKHLRIPSILHLHITHINDDSIGIGATLNVSEGGCCILSENELTINVSYKLIFQSKNTGITTCISAKVIYQNHDSGIFKIGFAFESTPDFKKLMSK